jgi:hypothetical protein
MLVVCEALDVLLPSDAHLPQSVLKFVILSVTCTPQRRHVARRHQCYCGEYD